MLIMTMLQMLLIINVTDVIDHRDDDAHDGNVLQMLLIIEMIILVIMMATLTQDVMVNIEVGTQQTYAYLRASRTNLDFVDFDIDYQIIDY